MKADFKVNMGAGLSSYFHETLPVSQVITEISVPSMNSSNNEASFEFDLPFDITNPMLYVLSEGGGETGYFTYFQQISSTRWRCVFWGIGIVWNTAPRGWRPNWTEPLVKPGTKILIGGWRG